MQTQITSLFATYIVLFFGLYRMLQRILFLYNYNTILGAAFVIYAMLPMSHHALGIDQRGGTFLQ